MLGKVGNTPESPGDDRELNLRAMLGVREARCPRFASGFWTLTWAEKGPVWPTEHFSTHDLGPSTRIRSLPDHFGMNRIYTLAGAVRSDPRLAKDKAEPGHRASLFRWFRFSFDAHPVTNESSATR